jgi:GH24 family phage-related lysozyme (muramidase)
MAARIPTQYDLGQANPRAEQVGSGFSGADRAMMLAPYKAMEDMGQSISGFGLQLQKAEKEADAYTAKKEFYDFTMRRENELSEAEKNMEPGGKDFQANTLKRYDEEAKALEERVPQRMRGRVGAMVAQHRAGFGRRAFQAEAVEFDRYETEQLDGSINATVDKIAADPDSAQGHINDLENLIESSHLSNRAKFKILNGDGRTPSLRQRLSEQAAEARALRAADPENPDVRTIEGMKGKLLNKFDNRQRDPLVDSVVDQDALPPPPKAGEEDVDARTYLRDKLQDKNRRSDVDNLHPVMQDRMAAFIDAAEQAGHDIKVVSGHRDFDRQAVLWRNAVRKYGSAAEARRHVAPPGGSTHEFGEAVDLSFGDRGPGLGGKRTAAVEWAHKNAAKYGLSFPLGHEDWHIEPHEARQGGKRYGGKYDETAQPLFRGRRKVANIESGEEAEVRARNLIRGEEGWDTGGYDAKGQYATGYGSSAKYPGEKISKEEAERRLAADTKRAYGLVHKFAPDAPEGVKAALTSLTYNTGSAWMRDGLGDAIQEGNYVKAKELFKQYNKVEGRRNEGVAERRLRESKLFDEGGKPVAQRGVTAPIQSSMVDEEDDTADKPTRVASSRQTMTDASGGAGMIPVERGELPPAKGDVPQPTEPGNIDLSKRPTVQNEDGSVSTIKSTSVNIDGKEYLLPTIDDDGSELDADGAVERFKRTGEHLGIFDNPEDATAYAKSLSQQQGERLGGDVSGSVGVSREASTDILGSDRRVFNGAVSQQPDMSANEVLSKETIDRLAEKYPGITGETTLAEIADRTQGPDKYAGMYPEIDNLTPKQAQKLYKKLATFEKQTYSAQIEKSKKLMESDVARIKMTGESEGAIEKNQFITPNQYQKYLYNRRIAEFEYAATGNIQNMTEEEALRHMGTLDEWAEGKVVDVNGKTIGYDDEELLKHKVRIYELAKTKWDKIQKERAENPAMAVKDDPAVKAAITAYKQSGGQEGLGGVVDARLAAQRRLGIPEDPITSEEGRALVARFNLRSLTDRNFDSAVKGLATHIQNRYGLEHAPAVFASVLKQQFGSAEKAAVVADMFEKEGRLMPGRINEEAARKAQERLKQLDDIDAEAGAFDPARAFQRPSGQASWDRADYSGARDFSVRGPTTTGPEIGASTSSRGMMTSPPAGVDYLPNRASGWFDRGSSPSLNARRATDKDYWPKPKDEAVADLKKDPGLAAAFDKTFGPGAAARALRR